MKHQLSITRDYCHDWTVNNALREIAQNMLDAPQEAFHEIGEDYVVFGNKNASIPPKTLLMGVTTKRNDGESVGGKGEGFKIACAILLREGIEVTVNNGNTIWEPCFEYVAEYDEEVLTFYEKPSPNGVDLSFVVSGLSEEHIEELKHDCLYLSDGLEDVLEGSRGNVIKDFSGRVYVGGLYVCSNPQLQYSYDFKPQYLPLNRDRRSVSEWDLRIETSKLLSEVLTVEEIVDKVGSTWDLGQLTYNLSPEVADEMFDRFISENDGCLVVEYESEREYNKEMYGVESRVISSSLERDLIIGCSRYSAYEENLKEEKDTEEMGPIELLEHKITSLNGLTYSERSSLLEVVDKYKEMGVRWDG